MNIYLGKKAGEHGFQTRLDTETTHRLISQIHEWAISAYSKEHVSVQSYPCVREIHSYNTKTIIGYDDIRQYTSSVIHRKTIDKAYIQIHKIDVDTTIPPSNAPIHCIQEYKLVIFAIHGQFTLEFRTYYPDTPNTYQECIIHVEKPIHMNKLMSCLKALDMVLN